MPIVKRGISHPLAYGDSRIYKNSPSNQVFQNINVAGMTGSLAQIGYLAAYASEIFEDLFRVANSLNEKIADISGRTGRLVTQITRVEGTISNASSTLVLGSARLDRGDDTPQMQFFLPESKPVALQMRYESPDVARPPPLELVDPVLLPQTAADHGPCRAKFSNPDFFVNEWKREEEDRLQKLQEEKQIRKKERKDRRQREKERKAKEMEASARTRVQKAKVNWRDRLNVDDVSMPRKDSFRRGGGVADDLVERQPTPSSPQSRVSHAPSADDDEPVYSAPVDSSPSQDDDNYRYMALPPSPAPPIPSMVTPQAPQINFANAPMGIPPPSRPMPPNMPAPPMPPMPGMGMPAPPMPGMGMPPMPPPGVPPTPPSMPYQRPPPPGPPMPPPLPQAPMPPPLPNSPLAGGSGGGIAGSLLVSIQTGKKLRVVEQVEKRADPQRDFLQSIRAGKALKKVEPTSPTKEASAGNLGAFGGSAISDILARRKYLQAEDSEGSDDDADDW